MKSSTRLAVITASLILSACGGGGGGANTASTADVPQPIGVVDQQPTANAETPPVAANATDIPLEDGATHTEYGDVLYDLTAHAMASATSSDATASIVTTAASAAVVTADFESNFSWLAPGWAINWWGNPATYNAGRESRAGYAKSGSASQRFRVSALGAGAGAHLVYSYGFVKDSAYVASVYLRSDVPAKVELQIRRNGSPFNVVASKTVNLSATWQKVELQGTYPYADAGALRIIPLTLGADVYLDDMSIQAVPAPAKAAVEAVAVGGISLPAVGGSAIETTVLKTINADEAFTRFASGFYFNSMGGVPAAEFVASREARPAYVQSGFSSQKFQLVNKNNGDVHLTAAYPFVKGKTYRASMYLRADEPTPAQVFMRMDAHPWQPFATSNVTIGTEWQKVEIEGAYVADVPGSVRVSLKNKSGTFWIDQLVISEVIKNDMAPVSTAAIPDTLFGMHVNRLGVHQNWPGLNTKAIRLWNTATTWRDIQPAKGVWDFRRLDMYVRYILKNEPAASILYTLGQTPQWASSSPATAGVYGVGASSPPSQMDDWRNYVRALAVRYAGQIQHWELWNEADYSGTYHGTVEQLVEMARIAHEELKAADPNNQLVSPGYTTGQGVPALDAFLAAGGGKYIDVVGFHWYYSTNPESIGPSIDNVRRLMQTYGVTSKPLWNTEGAFICNPAVVDCSTAAPTLEESRSVNARALFIMAAKGIANFNYHTWEAVSPFSRLVNTDYVTPTVAARTFAEARTWAMGARVVDAYRIDDKVYVIRMSRGQDNFVVLWATQANTLVNLPSAWNVTKVRSLAGTETAIPSNRQISLGLEPVQLRL